MKVFKISPALLVAIFFLLTACNKAQNVITDIEETITTPEEETDDYRFYMPDENQPHEGTWLQWPHEYEYGETYRDEIEATWVDMTRELVQSENVHIIAYNEDVKSRIIAQLNAADIPLDRIDFYIFKTNDVWVRDNGPIFVQDEKGEVHIEDWGFNGWGYDARFAKCDKIPKKVAGELGLPVLNLTWEMVIEGGGFEIDGEGTLLACKSSILGSDRNPGLSQKVAEDIFYTYLGIENVIWLNGISGADITDMHIDGFARFGNPHTIVTMDYDDLRTWKVPAADIEKLYAATNADGEPYDFVYLPLTTQKVKTLYGENVGKYGSYANFYVANTKVLMPAYGDPNDEVAKEILQELYPNREVVSINVQNLYKNGGMIHCVTQQQPAF